MAGERAGSCLTRPTLRSMRVLILPAWMYQDPAEVAERIETGERRAHLRAILPPDPGPSAKPRRNFGLVGADTVRLIKRKRIRELMRTVRKW